MKQYKTDKIWNGYEVVMNQKGTEFAINEKGVVVAKRCGDSSCGEMKPLSDFSGRCYRCKPCNSRYYKEMYYKNREKKLEYGKNYAKSHKEQQQAYQKQYRKNNKSRKLVWYYSNPLAAKVRSANSHSAKNNNGKISIEEFGIIVGRFLIDDDVFSCPYCGRETYISTKGFHLDHFIPRSLGGRNEAFNAVPCCTYCNHSKWQYDFFEWSRDYFGHLHSMGFKYSPYQVQKRMVDYFKEYYDIDYSDRINVPAD